MKKVLMPFEGGGNLWVVTHRLSLASERNNRIRAIHIWTFLGCQAKPSVGEDGYRLFMALENKLYGVRLARSRLRQALSYALDPCYSHGNVQDYDGENQVIFDLEAYLSAIYSALEIASMINKRQDHTLPRGFRSQGKKNKFPLFDFAHWPWLPLFYDLRTLLAHYSSPFPILSEKAFLLEVEDSSGLMLFKKGKQRVEFDAVLSFADNLFGLLDVWALFKLQDVDPEAKTFQIHSRNFTGPLKGKNAKASPFLKMARRFQRMAAKGAEDEWLKDLLDKIAIKV